MMFNTKNSEDSVTDPPSPTDLPAHSEPRSTWAKMKLPIAMRWQSFLALLLLLLIQAVTAYWPAFHVQPAGDDHDLTGKIYEANEHGVLPFFIHPPPADYYRPGKATL